MKSGVYLLFVLTMFSNIVLANGTKQLSNKSEETTISLVGDILMDGSIRTQINKNGVDYPWEHVRDYFLNDDLTIGNLETSITTRGTKWPDKQFNFRSDPKNLKAMEDAGMEILALSNNHSLDYGEDGFLDTIDHLDKSKLKRTGGGKNKKEALEGVIVERNGLKIGVLSFSRVVPDVKWYATEKRAGIVGAYDPHIKEVLTRIEGMKKDVDILVLSIHWGVELSTSPRKQEIDLAKKLIDSGADIIMGHHPHVLQGVEIYKDKPIFYSLGNFIFGTKSKLTASTMIGQVNLLGNEIESVKIIPCTIVSGRPIPDAEIKESIKYMNTISKSFKTSIDKDGIIQIKK